MLVRATTSFSGPAISMFKGEQRDISEDMLSDFLSSGLVEQVGEAPKELEEVEMEQPEEESEEVAPVQPKKTKSKK